MCRRRDGLRLHALKEMNKKRIFKRGGLTNILGLTDMVLEMDSKFISKLEYCFMDDKNLYSVFDLAFCGDLKYFTKYGFYFYF